MSIELCLLSDFPLIQVVEGIEEMLPEAAGGDHASLPGGVAGCLLRCHVVQPQGMATLLDCDVFSCREERRMGGVSFVLGCAATVTIAIDHTLK